jgi:16S rRNA (guanine527-N7)-methyltransferase
MATRWALQVRFQQLYDLILEGNQRFNLTRITQPEEFWEKHLWDSLSGLAWLEKSQPDLLTKSLSVIDLGTIWISGDCQLRSHIPIGR